LSMFKALAVRQFLSPKYFTSIPVFFVALNLLIFLLD